MCSIKGKLNLNEEKKREKESEENTCIKPNRKVIFEEERIEQRILKGSCRAGKDIVSFPKRDMVS